MENKEISNWIRQREIHEKSSKNILGDVFPDFHRFKVTNRFIKSYLEHVGYTLDVGCNTGYYLNNIIKSDARFGVDLSRSILKQAKVKANFICAVGEHLPFKDDTFTSVLCLELIEHVLNPELLIEEIARVMRPSGILLLSTPVKSTSKDFTGSAAKARYDESERY